MAGKPTEEQQAARDVFAAGRDLALVAGAGTGKTSTLILMGAATRKRGLYVAFNSSIVHEARSKFGSNVECRTSHSLAFVAHGHRYQERLDASAHMPGKQVARLLEIPKDLDINGSRITRAHQARLVMNMVRRFCFTTDRELASRHMERLNGLDQLGQAYVAGLLLPYAVKAWEDICFPRGRLRFVPDHYLKMWALTKPVLAADFILLDEAQDTNPVLEEVFLAQDAQRVCVGDPAQQIYAWRDARDVMTSFPAEHLHLTQSFRFGPQIAAVANRWLHHADSPMRLSGCGPATSRVQPVENADAVLCRGNAEAMKEVLNFLERGVAVSLTGGGKNLRRIATAAQELQAGRRTSHPELFLFTTWGEVQDYVEHDASGQDLKTTVDLVDTYGPDKIIQAIDHLTAENQAKVSVSTTHKAKGREWASVRIGEGFLSPPTDADGIPRPLTAAEARLIYVAVTRARYLLDVEGINWIDAYEKATADNSGTGLVAGRPMIDLSLTGQLKYPTSPVSQFMAQHLPRSYRVVKNYLQRIADLPHPLQPIDTRYPSWAALGHAIDFRLRLALGSPLGGTVATGVEALASDPHLVGAPSPDIRAALHAAGKHLLAAVSVHLGTGPHLHEEALVRLCFVAAFYEAVGRTGEINRFSLLSGATPSTTLRDLTAAVPAYAITDINRQMRLAASTFAPLRSLPKHAKTCGPVFAGSADIGGADADFVLDGLLLDCKATIYPHKLGAAEVYQLAGYLLLDYDDRFHIDRVGLYLSRQGGLITWEVQEFLHHLGATQPLAYLRTQMNKRLRQARTSAIVI
ncbi:UvrD-helicase domain-containing protein [Nonomuraea sp. NPDC050022]|uniref:UvrD-helicase domain-containing protein n=1 Tax=unclassified Nonomuraea TaxID=2593643 RepID=UPI0033E24829